MAMTPKLWSISALAVEFGMDRRTVAQRLADVPPRGKLSGSPAWRLEDAACVLAKRPRAAAAAPDDDNPADQMAAVLLAQLVRTAPERLAEAAEGAAEGEKARAIHQALREAAVGVLEGSESAVPLPQLANVGWEALSPS
ncbi:MAG: hypothetical protein AAF675_05565 [Pseudomonadota bacterium]